MTNREPVDFLNECMWWGIGVLRGWGQDLRTQDFHTYALEERATQAVCAGASVVTTPASGETDCAFSAACAARISFKPA